MSGKSIILIIFCLYTGAAFGQSMWKQIADEQGIKVFSKSVTYSKVKALKVECELNASTSAVVGLLLDIDAAPHWIYHTKSCALLKKVSPAELFYYPEVSLPWPLDNRDFVAHVKVVQDPLTKVVTVTAPAVSGWVAVKKDIVRISESKGLWIITPLSKDKVRLEYTLQVDPGGGIPAWVVNTFAAQGPLESFKNMRQLLGTAKYKNLHLDFVN